MCTAAIPPRRSTDDKNSGITRHARLCRFLLVATASCSILTSIAPESYAQGIGTGKHRPRAGDMIDLVGLPRQSLDLPPLDPMPPLDKPPRAPLVAPASALPPAPPPRPRDRERPVRLIAPALVPPPPVQSLPATPAAEAQRPAAPVALATPQLDMRLAVPPEPSVPDGFVARIEVQDAQAVSAGPRPVRVPLPARRPVDSRPALADIPAPAETLRAAPFDTAVVLPRAEQQLESPRIARLAQRSAPAPADDAALTTGSIPKVRITYVVRHQPLDQVLREIGHLGGFSVVPGGSIRGDVREKRLEGSPDRILDQLAREYGLFWFYDGMTAYVDPSDQQKTRFFKVKGSNQAQLSRAIDAAGLGKYKDRIQFTGKDGLVRVAGSDAFNRSVEAALSSTEPESSTISVIRFGYKGH